MISPQIELKEAAQNMEERHELVFAARVGAEVGRKAREATVSGGNSVFRVGNIPQKKSI